MAAAPGQIPINPQPLTVSRGFVHRRLSDAGPLTGSITHTWPASEPLTGSKSKALTPPHQYQTFGGPGMAVADHGMEMAFAAIRSMGWRWPSPRLDSVADLRDSYVDTN